MKINKNKFRNKCIIGEVDAILVVGGAVGGYNNLDIIVIIIIPIVYVRKYRIVRFYYM